MLSDVKTVFGRKVISSLPGFCLYQVCTFNFWYISNDCKLWHLKCLLYLTYAGCISYTGPHIFYTATADLSDLLHRRGEPWFHIPCYSQANGQRGSWRSKNIVLVCRRDLLRIYPCTVHSQFLFSNPRGKASEVCVGQYLPITLKSVRQKS